MRKCKCGGTFIYHGYDEITIDENNFLRIDGECKCNKCEREAYYSEYFKVNFETPFKVNIDTNVDGVD